MSTYDVIVVGGGPAGATAAYRLSTAGLNVLILEKESFPRYKPCGGGLSVKIDRILDLNIREIIEATVNGAYFSYNQREGTYLLSDRPVAYTVMRKNLDSFLTSAAIKAGASFLTGKGVKGVSQGKNDCDVFVEGQVFKCKYVVGADGANGVVRRFIHPHTMRSIVASIEAEITVEEYLLERHNNYVHIDFGIIPYGYAWVFPKKKCLSVGIAGFKGVVKRPKEYLDKFIKGNPTLSEIERYNYKGYPIPLFMSPQHLTKGGVILVGDAGNLVDPFFGEGIYYAIRSAQIASSVICESIHKGGNDLSKYDRLLSDELYPEFRAAQTVSQFVYAFPRIWYDILTEKQELAEKYYNVLRGESKYEIFLKELKAIGGSLVKTAIKKGLARLFR